MREYFDYGDLGNSVLYLLAGLELVFVSIGIAWLSKRIEVSETIITDSNLKGP